MRPWRIFEGDPTIRRTGMLTDSLAAWMDEVLRTIPAGPIEVETNLGGLDEAGTPSPDFDWVGTVAGEYPNLEVRAAYREAHGREEATAPYEVVVRWGATARRARVEVTGPGRWVVLEE
jgi:hypothetical protein